MPSRYQPYARIIEQFLSAQGIPLPARGVAPQLRGPERELYWTGRGVRFKTGYGEFNILSERDVVVSWVAPPLHARHGEFSLADAKRLAVEFAARAVPDLSSRYELEPERGQQGQFRFDWRRKVMPGEVAVSAASVSVTVSERSQAVRHYERDDLDLARTEPVKITREQAKRIMRKISGDPKAAVESLDLYVRLIAPGSTQQETVWSGMLLRDGGPYGVESIIVAIDADTGKEVPRKDIEDFPDVVEAFERDKARLEAEDAAWEKQQLAPPR